MLTLPKATLRWSLLSALCFSSACALEPVAAGQSCTRSTQCKTGLACVYPTSDGTAKEGRCSADLTSLYDPSQVPMLTPEAGVVMTPDGGADIGMGMGAGGTAATAMPDAG